MNYASYLYRTYTDEIKHLAGFEPLSETAFQMYVSQELSSCGIIQRRSGNELDGVLFYGEYEREGKLCCVIPSCGYYAKNRRTLASMFTELAEKEAEKGECTFEVRLYAHDEQAIRTFHNMQFYSMSETCAKRIESLTADDKYDIRVLTAEEIQANWRSIWGLTKALIDGLKGSPAFYPCTEFTEQAYRGFYTDADTQLLAAFSGGEIVGIIRWNRESRMDFCTENSVNVGEIYVVPQLRGTGLAKALLDAAEKTAKEAGAEYMWVEYGTANPCAVGFCGKYFTPFETQLLRTITAVQEEA